MKVRDPGDQPAGMKVTTLTDRHGRRWEITLDKESLTHLGVAIPKFRAPLYPPPQYVRTDGEKFGRLLIDYDRWEADWAAEQVLYDQRLLVLRRTEPNEHAVQDLAGDPPQSVEFVRAARAGNPWVLGLPHPVPGKRYTCPDALRPLLGRIGPRPTTAADLRSRVQADRAQYAATDEDIEDIEDTEDVAAGVMARDAEPPVGDEDEQDGAASEPPDDFDEDDFEDEPAGFGDEGDEDETPAAVTQTTQTVTAAPAKRKHRAKGG